MQQTAAQLDEMGHSLSQKATIKDIKPLNNIKQAIEEINYTVTETHADLRSKISKDEFAKAIDEQAGISGVLMAENCVGRWIWRSGHLNSSAVPWEIQSTNTCPDNFIWDQDRTHIMTIAPGLYEVHYAFFVQAEPEVSCMVNGEVVLSGSSTCGTKAYGKHTAGD